MEEINLDKYKSAWKAEHSFEEEKLSRDRIMAFMSSASKSIGGLFRKSLIFDMIVKSILAFSSGALMVLYSDQNRMLPVLALLILLVISTALMQARIYRKIPGGRDSAQSARELLHSYISFYSRSFVPSLITASLTGPLVFVIGALSYFFFKFGTIRPLEFDDFLVFGSIIVISFLLSAFVQIRHFSFHIGQLKESLAEIENETLTESRLRYYYKLKYRNLVIYSIILIAGFLIFFLFLLQAG
ncbi:MAG: hypothetical protein R2756_07585 [Bacteroidales bacterium]